MLPSSNTSTTWYGEGSPYGKGCRLKMSLPSGVTGGVAGAIVEPRRHLWLRCSAPGCLARSVRHAGSSLSSSSRSSRTLTYPSSAAP